MSDRKGQGFYTRNSNFDDDRVDALSTDEPITSVPRTTPTALVDTGINDPSR